MARAVTPNGPIGPLPFTGAELVSSCLDMINAATDVIILLVTMAAAYHGGNPGSQQFVKNPTLQQSISAAMNWWFSRDFTASDCLYNGGNTGNCPCGTPGLWNTNWFSNVRGRND